MKETKKFGTGQDLPADDFDYVADPAIFHRYMRKHLFLADSDAAILAIAKDFLGMKKDDEYRVLEIGCGTGALTEKLVNAGISPIDAIEPDLRLFEFWQQQRERLHLESSVQSYCQSLEEFIGKNGGRKYDLIVSQGVHHHIPTQIGHDESINENYRLTFLQLCAELLKPNGIYILSDEFLLDYENEAARLDNLGRWYRCVISTALADGLSDLADLEYNFWLNDRNMTVEYKESIEKFAERLALSEPAAPFKIRSVTKFGMTKEYGGGFGVLVMNKNITARAD